MLAREQDEQVRVVATRIERDGTMQRRVVDTCHCGDGPQSEVLTARALAVPPPYRPVPGIPVYHVGLDDGTVVLVAADDLCGPLLDLVTAVLAMGDAVLARSRFRPSFRKPSSASHGLAGRHRTQAPVLDNWWTMTCGYGFRRTGRTLGIDLRIRRLGVRVPPSAPRSEAPYRIRKGAFLVRLGATLGATGIRQPPNRARLIDSAAARLSPSSRCPYTSLVMAMLA